MPGTRPSATREAAASDLSGDSSSRWYRPLLRFAPRPARHRALFLSSFLAVLAASAVGLRFVPLEYEAHATILEQGTERVQSLTTPGLKLGPDSATDSARALVMGRENLLSLCRQVDFLPRYLRGRQPLQKARDWVVSLGLGTSDGAEERLNRLLDSVEKKLWVESTRAGIITLAFAWPDPDLALDFVQAATRSYLDARQMEEVNTLRDGAVILRAHTARLQDRARALSAHLTDEGQPLPSPLEINRGAARFRKEPGPKPPAPLERMRPGYQEPEDPAPAAEGLAESGSADGSARTATGSGAPPRDSTRPDLDSLRDELRAALHQRATLFALADAADVQMEGARAAFRQRYTVLVPPEMSRGPLRTYGRMLLGASLGALAFALLGSAVPDLPLGTSSRRGRGGQQPGGARPGGLGRLPALVALKLGGRRRATAVAAVGVLTVAATIAGGGRPVFAMAPALVAAVGYLLAKLPLRYSATALLFLLLALEVSGDALDLWSTPLVRLGDLLTDCSGAKTGLKVSGSEAILAFLIGVMFYRRATGSSIDGAPRPMATIVRDSLVIYLLGFVYMEALGAVHGLDTATWKARYLLHVLAFFFVFQAAYRSAEDARPVAAAVVVAAHIKALLAAWVQTVVAPAMTGGELAFATNHGDSVLFVMSIVLVLTAAMEKPDQRNVLRAALLIPLPLWALVLNQRRTAWAMLGAAVAVVFATGGWYAWKRSLVRSLIVSLPVLLLYGGVGWFSTSRIFAPVQQVRSMLDPSIDLSTYWREVENFNIATSLKESFLLGQGLGGEYTEAIVNDDISANYPDYRRWPHNTVLGLLILGGAIGFVATWFLRPLTVFLAYGSYRRARNAAERVLAMGCISAIICCLSLEWGDTGLHFTQAKLALALGLALAGNLAVATGAWPNRVARGAPR